VDTSALVKLLIAEAGTLQTQAAVREAEVVGTSILSYAELRAAIASARRANRVAPERYSSLIVEVNSLWHSLLRIVIDEDLVLRAGDLAERFGLRGYDAMQLALGLTSARRATLNWRGGTPTCRTQPDRSIIRSLPASRAHFSVGSPHSGE